VVLVALLLMSGWPARAADPRLDSARAHSQEGDSYYKLEKYANAITEYEQAYLAKPDPSFLYNIAQCHRLMGQGPEAIKFYRRFLKDAPTAPNRAVAEKHIRDLEDASSGMKQPPAPVPPPVTSTRPAPIAPAPVSVIPPPSPPSTSLPSSSTSTSPAFNPLLPTSTPVSTTPTVENGATSTQTESHPIYSRWWFWAGVGAVVVGGIILIAAVKHDPSCPGGFNCQGN
jgi:tetratricopeptide (TPR) repeat protein